MAEGFDFEKYYVNEKVKTEAAINRTGVILQNTTEPSEIATNNVVYYVASLYVKNIGSSEFIQLTGESWRICIIEDPTKDESERSYYYLRQWHQLGDVATLGISDTWEPKGLRDAVFESNDADADYQYAAINDAVGGNPVPVTAFRAVLYPRYETEVNEAETEQSFMSTGVSTKPINQDVVQYPKLMRLMYGALGLQGGRWKGLRWLERIWDKNGGMNDNAVIPYDRFVKCMNYLADVCKENDVGFSVTYYDQTFAKEVTVEDATREEYRANRARARAKHNKYRVALSNADITRTDLPTRLNFIDAYGNDGLGKFLTKMKTEGYFEPTGSAFGNATALLPPVKTAVQAFFYDREELETNFSSLFRTVMEGVTNIPYVWRFVDTDIKTEIGKAKDRYQETPKPSGRMLFDLDIAVARLTNTPDANKVPYAIPRAIQETGNGDSGYSLIVGIPGESSTMLTAWTSEVGHDIYTGYKNGNNSKENLRRKNFVTTSASEVADYLVNSFNDQVDAGAITALKVEKISAVDGKVKIPDELQTTNPIFYGWATYTAAFMNIIRYYGKNGEQIDATTLFANCFTPNGIFGTSNNSDWASRWLAVSFGIIPENVTVFSGEYDIISWENGVVTGSKAYSDMFEPQLADMWRDITTLPYESFGMVMDAVSAMRRAYKQMNRAVTTRILQIGPVRALKAAMKLDDLSDDFNEFADVCDKLVWYQRLVEESPFTNKSTIPVGNNPTLTSSFPAHFMFPVHMYKRVRVKYKNFWGRTRHRMQKRSIGVRWAEVTFTDASVFNEYPVVNDFHGEQVGYSGGYSIDGRNIVLDEPLPSKVVDAGDGMVQFASCKVHVTVKNDILLEMDEGAVIADVPGAIQFIKIPLPPSQPDGSRESVEIQYKMPGLPYDSEIRKRAFVEYGSLSQASYFEAVRNTGSDDDKHEGWKIFYPSSAEISAMRDGIGVHDKVAMLLSILKHEFGDSRVQLTETRRSMEDQEKMCTGGPESAFLSWHNYGLAAQILILKSDGKTPLEKDDEEVKRLSQVARAFTEGCLDGKFGTPCNVVWCARLAVGPSLFDWEFLPIGVGHKDAPKFRNILISQSDPVHELGYVDVDGENLVKNAVPSGNVPYVLASSPALASAEKHGGHRFMNPRNIRNFEHIEDIVLYDAREYVDLIKLKMNANGTARPESGSIYDWKALNPVACEQLIRYYAMVGSISASKALLAGDFVERYLPIEEQYYNSSPVDYVKGMLGENYADARICTSRDGRSSYITLSDGILHVKSLDAYPNNAPTRLDIHKQQKVDSSHVTWGIWEDGVFYSEEELAEMGREIPYIDSEVPVIAGYVNGEATEGEAVYLHQVVAAKIHKRFGEIRKLFENFGGALMYDRVEDGPNASMADMLENEFGLIAAQDLIPFDDLDTMLDGILRDAGKTTGVLGETGNIYEKVVDNAQISGFRYASLKKEHLHIKDLPTANDGKTLYDLIQKGHGYTANDIVSR